MPTLNKYLSKESLTLHILQLPISMHTVPTLSNLESICESAASLVFLNIKLARNIPTFARLPVEDQVSVCNELGY